eukprot:Opistho-2@65649
MVYTRLSTHARSRECGSRALGAVSAACGRSSLPIASRVAIAAPSRLMATEASKPLAAWGPSGPLASASAWRLNEIKGGLHKAASSLLTASRMGLNNIGSSVARRGSLVQPAPTRKMSTVATKVIPRLPVPELQETCDRYLRYVRPLVNDAQMEKTKAAVAEFLNGDGPELHNVVVKLANPDAENEKKYPFSYIEKFWDDMYLNGRWALPINSNPFFLLRPDTKRTNIADRAASLIEATTRFHMKIHAGLLETDKAGDTPLDMSQYRKLFGTCRIPKVGRDRLLTKADSKHIGVLRKGHFYFIPVATAEGSAIPEADISKQLKTILNERIEPPKHFIGVMTTADRDLWARWRPVLTGITSHSASSSATINNASLFELIDTSLFLVCLDEGTANESVDDTARRLLHGDGRNRWFDKSIQIIVADNGTAGVNFEHAWGDGHTVVRYLHEAWHHAVGLDHGYSPLPQKIDNYTGVAPVTEPKRVDMVLTPEARRIVDDVQAQYDEFVKDTHTETLNFRDYGKAFCKTLGVSPDATIQVAMQLAYFRTHGTLHSFYESCMTKHFLRGRTEAIRSVNSDSLAFVTAFGASSPETRLALFRKAAKAHVGLVNECKNGRGVDRHLFAMRCVARGDLYDGGNTSVHHPGLAKTPSIFTDAAYSTLTTTLISTSSLSAASLAQFGFGAVDSDGYGIGYCVEDNEIIFTVSAFRSKLRTTVPRFRLELIRALRDIAALKPQ